MNTVPFLVRAVIIRISMISARSALTCRPPHRLIRYLFVIAYIRTHMPTAQALRTRTHIYMEQSQASSLKSRWDLQQLNPRRPIPTNIQACWARRNQAAARMARGRSRTPYGDGWLDRSVARDWPY